MAVLKSPLKSLGIIVAATASLYPGAQAFPYPPALEKKFEYMATFSLSQGELRQKRTDIKQSIPVSDYGNAVTIRLITEYLFRTTGLGTPRTADQSRLQGIESKQECLQAGGKWMPQMNIDAPWLCRLPAKDRGKTCVDSSECEKFCQAPKGSKPGAKVVGECADSGGDCNQEVENGIAKNEACQL
jgi:hypothetical protein